MVSIFVLLILAESYDDHATNHMMNCISLQGM
jgi:hypothetical protein